MDILGLLVRRGIARSVPSLVALASVLGAGLGVGFTSIEIADRTERAYPDYLRRAHVGNMVVNPSLVFTDTEQMIRSTPGVLGLTSDALLSVMVNDDPSNFVQVRMSSDGRYATQDRPVVRDGRLVESGAEAFLSVNAAEHLGVAVGDTLTLGFFTPQFSTGEGEATEAAPLGTEQARVVGVGTFSDEVLVDELVPRMRVIVTPDIAAKYDCLVERPGAEDPRSFDELLPELTPATCTTSYRYFSLTTAGGDAGAQAVADALAERFQRETEQLPAVMRENRLGFALIASFTEKDTARVRQSLSPVVTSLQAFGYASLLTTIGAVLLLAVRLLRRRERDAAVWHALGVSYPTRTSALALPLVGSAVIGVALAIGVTWFASGIGPMASARTVVPDPARGLSASLWLPTVSTVVLLGIGLVGAAARGARRPAVDAGRAAPPGRVLDLFGTSPSAALGTRAALRGRGAGAVIAGSVLAVGAVTATLVFSASVVHFVDTPARFGWSYDAGVLVNFGYGLVDKDAVDATLARPEVERWGIASLADSISVNGSTLPSVAAGHGFEDLIAHDTVVAGRLPQAADEVALGSHSADDLGLHIGDEVTVNSLTGEARARVTGLVVLPALGPFESDRAALGTGVLLPRALLERLLASDAERTGRSASELVDLSGTFIAVDLAPGVDPAAFLERITDQLPEWDPYRIAPEVYARPVRPASVVDVDAMRHVPVMLAGAFALAMGVSVVAGIASGTRARRRELEVLRALGGTPGQVRASVRWHAMTVVLVGIVVGLPIGVVIGRVAFNAFARDLGAAPRSHVPLVLLAAIVLVVLATGIVASVVPARHAATRREPLDVASTHRAVS